MTTTMLAHGVGERGQLPLSVVAFGWGMAAALALSFVLLGVLWKQPRLEAAARGRPLADVTGPVLVVQRLAQTLALALYLLCLAAAWWGFDAPFLNITPVAFYVILWVGAQLVGGLVGDVWAAINPIGTIARGAEVVARFIGRPPGTGPANWGDWPAAVGLSVFIFYELSHPSGTSPRTLAWLLTVHGLITVAAGLRWGRDWVVAHEPMTVFLARVAAMAPLFRRADGRLGLRPPVSGLATMPVRPGTLSLLLIVLGGTSFDGFSEGELGRELFADLFGWSLAWAELGGLILSITLVSGLYHVGVLWVQQITGLDVDEGAMLFAPSLVPITVGYAVAHYFSLLYNESQSFVFRLSDPFGRGWDLFGGSDGRISPIDPDLVAWVMVAAILLGHVGAVMVAHDRSIGRFDPGRSLQSQLAMLFVMIGYAILGLWLLMTA